MTKYLLLLLAFISFIVNINGCKGKKDSGGDPAPVQAAVVQGIAASGKPISGTVYLCDSATNTLSAITTAAGEFSIDATGLKAPFLLKSVDALNNEMFTYADAPGTVNINPLTTLAVAVASGATNSASLTALYDSLTKGTGTAVTQTQWIASRTSITTSLQPLLKSFGSETSDPFSGAYLVNHHGLDELFDKVAISISTRKVFITRKDTGSSILASSFDALSTSAVNTINIPQPEQGGVTGNAKLTLKVQGVLPPGTLIKNASFTVQLPLGVTVVHQSTFANAPAIPIEAAAGANIYPAPTLTGENDNMLHISLSSLPGFGAGAVLELWYFDSPSYLNTRTPADFIISDAKYYSDIYQKQELHDLAVVPGSITFP